jgi:hypothetical protein
MSLPFDATLKDMARDAPRAFVSTFNAPTSLPVRVLSADLSTVTTSADVVIGLGDPLQEILHFDCHASASAEKHRDLLVYNALLHRQYRVPVHSIILLLRPQAAHSNLSGMVSYQPRAGRGKMEFSYEVIRVWEIPASTFLDGELGTAALAPLGQLPEGVALQDGLSAVIHRLIERLQRDASEENARKLLTAAFVLTGLRVRRQLARELFQGVRAVRESDTYMAIIDEGRLDEAKRILLRLGRKRFGPPTEAVEAFLSAFTEDDIDRLEQLGERLLDVSSWQDLLDTP